MSARSRPRRKGSPMPGSNRSPAARRSSSPMRAARARWCATRRSEEHTSELQSLMRKSYGVFCLKKKKNETSLKTNLLNDYTKRVNNLPYTRNDQLQQSANNNRKLHIREEYMNHPNDTISHH